MKIARLQERSKHEIRKKRNVVIDVKDNNDQTFPEAEISALLKNVQVPEVVKNKLLLSEVTNEQLKTGTIT